MDAEFIEGVSRVWEDVSTGTAALVEGQDRPIREKIGLYIPLHASDGAQEGRSTVENETEAEGVDNMKCRIPERQRQLDPRVRVHIRRMLGDCAELTLAEVFDFGDKRLHDIRGEVQLMYAEYDAKHPDSLDYIRALVGLFETDGNSYIYPVRPGSGERVLAGREHDIVYLCYAYQLRRRGFGQVRINRFLSELCRRIRYYNRTFTGDYDDIVPTIENRLEQRGIRVGGDRI